MGRAASGLGSGSVLPSGRSRPQSWQFQLQLQHRSQFLRQYLRSLRDSRDTRPRAPSPVPQRRSRRARPSKRARTSGPGESSSSRPEPTPSPAVKATSSPQLSPASRIRRPLFVWHPIPGNVWLHRREFHGESYYDVPVLWRVVLFIATVHDAMAVLLAPGGPTILPFYDLPGSAESTRAPV